MQHLPLDLNCFCWPFPYSLVLRESTVKVAWSLLKLPIWKYTALLNVG